MNHGGTAHYMPVQNLEDWLGMPGHAILISDLGVSVNDKFFKHLHLGGHNHNEAPNSPQNNHENHAHKRSLSGDHLEFVLSGADVPPSGVYKIWAQFKHKGQILKFPFVFEI